MSHSVAPFRCLEDAQTKFKHSPVPAEVDSLLEDTVAIRDAFEHIDERAMGHARWEGKADAMSIFNQADLVAAGVLRYDISSIPA